MKTIVAPQPIAIGPQSVTFADFLMSFVRDDKMGANMDTLFKAFDMKAKVEAMNGSISFTDPEYDLLMMIAREPSNGYKPQIALHLKPFFDALMGASAKE